MFTRTATNAPRLLVAAAACAAGFSACSSEESCEPVIERGAEISCSAGNAPIDMMIAVDPTAIRGDEQVASEYGAATTLAAQPTIRSGGTLTVRAVRRLGIRSEVLLGADVPTLAEKADDVRGGDEADVADALASVVSSFATLPPGDRAGSDPVGEVVEMLSAPDRGHARVGVLLSDGKVDIPDLHLMDRARDGGAAAARDALLAFAPKDAAKLDALVILGIGQTGGKDDEHAAHTAALVEAWKAFCDRIARTCVVRARTS